ncbi:hypothetical protein CEE44_03470 [Candidatus Woesearchaeota archaeon B3_Woes]|nr:MAG: hypothetical protein CEE44_03470 [Candidatus Woesearchaeota archaeon B3_Woes]
MNGLKEISKSRTSKKENKSLEVILIMADISKDVLKGLFSKYKGELNKELTDRPVKKIKKPILSREYQEFKKELMSKKVTLYEKACNFSESVVEIKPKPEMAEKLQRLINISHLDITPTGAVTFSVIGPIIFIFVSILFSLMLGSGVFFITVALFVGLVLIKILSSLPELIANNWRMKSSNQMVICIFYIVTYMRHTSNLENAIGFASDHLAPPLSLDMKKVLWDIETKEYSSIKDALDSYLETWREWNLEFIEAFHLVESSLYESSEQRRVELLDKSLDVMLEETYEKMLHFAHDLQSPITTLHMLGVVMPILGLVILPLVVSFMEGVKWYHLSVLYNVLLPLGIFYMAKNILSTRPTGYGDSSSDEDNPELKKKSGVVELGPLKLKSTPMIISLVFICIFFFIGFSPIWIHMVAPDYDMGFGEDSETSVCGSTFCLLEYKMSKATEGPNYGKIIGPYGIGATILGLMIPLGLGVGAGLYFKLRSKNVMEIRNNAKNLEKEFAAALFQLGNRLGDGIPSELAFERVSDTMKGTASGNFFGLVSANIKKMGMSVHEAIFNKKTGAILSFPSNIIESSMKVLTVSVKKGPKVAAQALINVARYIKEIHRVDERLKDLMADIVGSMRSQIRMLTPVVSGIVIGITSMITTILGKLGSMFPTGEGGESAIAGASNVATMFGDGVPAYYFQIVVGIYVVQVVYILTIVINGIENGSDKLNERYTMGINLTKSVTLYIIISLVVILLFNTIAGRVLLTTIG